jgi:hypothetical protein
MIKSGYDDWRNSCEQAELSSYFDAMMTGERNLEEEAGDVIEGGDVLARSFHHA